jgi:hypothetical protein
MVIYKPHREVLDGSVTLLVGMKKPGQPFDFIILHVLTAYHAMRVILPEILVEWHARLFQQWWLFATMIYIIQVRPEIRDDAIADYNLKERDWEWVKGQAVDSKAALDAHYVKGSPFVFTTNEDFDRRDAD